MPVTFWSHDDRAGRAGRGAAAGRLLEQGGASLRLAAARQSRLGLLGGWRSGWPAVARSPPGTPPGCCCAPSSARPACRGVHPHDPPALMRWPVLLLAVPPRCSGWPRSGRLRASATTSVHLTTTRAGSRRCWRCAGGLVWSLGWLAPRRRAADPRALGRCGRLRQALLPRRRPARPGRTPGDRAGPRRSDRSTSRGGRAGRGHRPRHALGLGGWPGRAAPRRAAARGRRRAAARAALRRPSRA